jgi:hypothetical protein
MRCQSVGKPFTAEYWCIGGTTIRLRNSTPRMVSGVNNKSPDISVSSMIFVGLRRYRRRLLPQSGKTGALPRGCGRKPCNFGMA